MVELCSLPAIHLGPNFGGGENGDLPQKIPCAVTVHAPSPAAGHHQPMPLPDVPGHPQASLLTDHLTCLLRNLYAGQEATLRTGHGTTDWLQIGKGAHHGCILSPWLFNLYAEYT